MTYRTGIEVMNNPLLLDPTRTVTLRRSFNRGTAKAFARLRRSLTSLVRDEDAFALDPSHQDRTRQLHNSEDVRLVGTLNKRWAYATNEEAAEQFEKWLKAEVKKELLSEAEATRLRRFIGRGFQVGANRALNDVKRGRGKGARTRRFLDRTRGEDFQEGQREAFLRATLGRSTALEKLRLLQTQALSEVRGMSDDLVSRMRRSLVDGLIRNQTPKEIADRLSKTLDISQARARTIANTELVRAHAEGQLEAMEQLGVEKVGVAVEWSSLASACSLCSPLNHIVLKISEARGMLPRHPNCRCAWTLANIAESADEKKTQKRSKTKIDKALAKSSDREGGANDSWSPPQIDRSRPKQLTNQSCDFSPAKLALCDCSDSLKSFSGLLTSLGLSHAN